MGLSGKFVPKNELTIHVWEPPDKNGDGLRHTVQKQNEDGSFYWEEVTDSDGNEVFRYEPPEGFVNVPSRDESGRETENYVLKDERNQIVRDSSGQALSIVPGGAAVVHPDGTHEVVPPKDVKKFLARHTQVKG